MQGFAIAGGRIYAAYPSYVNSSVVDGVNGASIQEFDQDSGAAPSPVFQIQGLTPDAFAVSGTNLILASNESPINQPVPGEPRAHWPVSQNPAPLKPPITLAKFVLGAMPRSRHRDGPRQHRTWNGYPGVDASVRIVNLIQSPQGEPFFRIFSSQPFLHRYSPKRADTRSRERISQPSTGSPAVTVLVVSAHASQPGSDGGRGGEHPASAGHHNKRTTQSCGGPEADRPAARSKSPASVNSQVSLTPPFPYPCPFQVVGQRLPVLLYPLRRCGAATPATVNVTAQLEYFSNPAATRAESILVKVNGQTKTAGDHRSGGASGALPPPLVRA